MSGHCILLTGGAGFIGSNFVHQWLETEAGGLINLDKLTYAGNSNNLNELVSDARHQLVRGDICDRELLARLFNEHQPRAVVHFAAESHVDRSIYGPAEFIQTNIVGTFCLLEEARSFWGTLPKSSQAQFRFLHVSTDEVYGSLEASDHPFMETSAYAPNSPYAASKAASDHLVRAYFHTYGFPTLTTNCSNNYGPFQFPEKLIPLIILRAINGKPLPIYGDGRNVRDWLFVDDHCRAIRTVLAHGRKGETYNVGGRSEKQNLDIVLTICSILDELRPADPVVPHERLITFVKDRPGHDRRYAVDTTKINTELGWQPLQTLTTGLRKTIEWYLSHGDWVQQVVSGSYREWMSKQYTL
jgi:dTDP-glucose 4,6-dehydratase